jgi:hypothetical protein
MAFLRRLLFYLMGVGLGIALYYMIWGDRDFDFAYFPSARVKKVFRTKTLDSNSLVHNALDLSKDSLYYKAIVDGALDFTDPRKKPCGEYEIAFEHELHTYEILLQNCKDTVRVLDVQITD